MKISQFETDPGLEEDGVWIEIGDGAKLLVARLGNPNYRDRMRKLLKPFRRQIRNETFSDDQSTKLMVKAMSDTVLLGWEGLEDEEGSEIDYSPAKAEELMQMRDFRDLVLEIAQNQEAFRREEVEETGKS